MPHAESGQNFVVVNPSLQYGKVALLRSKLAGNRNTDKFSGSTDEPGPVALRVSGGLNLPIVSQA